MGKTLKKKYTGERMETHIFTNATIEHLHRYIFVEPFIKNKIVLDIACGVGYGTNLLASYALKLYGVDISSEAIDEAKSKYQNEKITFKLGSTSNIPIETNSIDVVISFETIEHHDQHDEMIQEILRVLKPNGILIISSPDKLNYSVLPNFRNEFHIKELYKNEFAALMEKYFKYVSFYSQKTVSGSLITQDFEHYNTGIKTYTGDFDSTESLDFKSIARFNLCVASNVFVNETTVLSESFFIGDDIINKQIQMRIDAYKNSNSFRLGNFIIKPIRKIVSFFR